MSYGILSAIVLLCLLAGCAAHNHEQQLQAAREQLWTRYGGKNGTCVRANGEPSTDTPPRLPDDLLNKAGKGLETPEILQVTNSHVAELRDCYESGMNGWPDLAGEVDVDFTIRPDGSVHSAAVASTTMNNGPVECCILGVVRSWRFPNSGVGANVTYPVVMKQQP